MEQIESLAPQIDPAYHQYQQERKIHWDKIAEKMKNWLGFSGAYHKHLKKVFQFLIPPGKRILELGCGQGDLLASLKPSFGVGIDFSENMVEAARLKHPDLQFVCKDVHEIELDSKFDVIILSDLVNDIWDVQAVLERTRQLCLPSTRIIINTYSRLWELPLKVARDLDLAKPVLQENWLTVEDVQNLFYLAGFEVIRTWQEFLFPFDIPLIEPLTNRFIAKIWPFNIFCLTNFILARPIPEPKTGPVSVSVIVPARNEAGNIREIFERVPEMGKGTELIFVEGNSTDNTLDTIQSVMGEYPGKKVELYRQKGKGKGDAVRLGFSKASGEILMILDADMTVPPENLLRFYEALISGKAEMVNGVRLVYPMEKEAMRFLNLIGNKFFSLVFSWLMGQPIKDTLCGTKVLYRDDYETIAANRNYFGDFDPFGDFDLLFGSAKINLKIIDLPIRYRERTYGTTNINRWAHGWLLLRMVVFAARRLKFI